MSHFEPKDKAKTFNSVDTVKGHNWIMLGTAIIRLFEEGFMSKRLIIDKLTGVICFKDLK